MAYDQAAAEWQRDATEAGDRIATALADLRAVMPEGDPYATHNPDCWRWHARCVAVRTIRTLTGEDPTNA